MLNELNICWHELVKYKQKSEEENDPGSCWIYFSLEYFYKILYYEYLIDKSIVQILPAFVSERVCR